MAIRIILFHLFTALVAVNLIFADEDSDRAFGLPFFGGGSDSDDDSSFLSSFFNSGSRQVRSADEPEPEEDESEHQERLFFATIVNCNYTSQGGTSCPSCRQALSCYPNNVGRLRTCRGLLRYCNNGRCSFSPGSQCSGNSTSG